MATAHLSRGALSCRPALVACRPARRPVPTIRRHTRLDATRVPSPEAAVLLESGYPYLDVRTPEEFADGHAVGAVNIPFLLKSSDGLVPNPDFVSQVRERFPDAAEAIVVGCRSGNRSAKACALLEAEVGFTSLTDDAGGWLGWVEAGLPTEK